MEMFVSPQPCPRRLEGLSGKAHYQEEDNGTLNHLKQMPHRDDSEKCPFPHQVTPQYLRRQSQMGIQESLPSDLSPSSYCAPKLQTGEADDP